MLPVKDFAVSWPVLAYRRWGDGLVLGEVALALSLTIGAGLLVRSYLLLERVNPGFDAHGVLTVSVNLPGVRFDSVTKVIGFYEELRERARTLPGVEAAAIVGASSPINTSGEHADACLARSRPASGNP